MASQDWLEKDFYKTLGVNKDADEKAIKKAYRQLARTYHPDKNPGDAKAEEKFKAVGEAYAVLSDPKSRQEYDALRAMASGGARFTAGGPGASSGAGFEDIFSMFSGGNGNVHFRSQGGGPQGFEDIFSMFSGGSGGANFAGGNFGGANGFGSSGFGSRVQKGEDRHAKVDLTFRQAYSGTDVTLKIDGKNVTARIPAGITSGKKVRLAGKGMPGINGGSAGDLYIEVQVQPHSLFALKGRDVTMTLPIGVAEACLGSTVEVPTVEGKPVKVKIPAGSASGSILRVKGKGVPATSSGKAAGDLLVTLKIVPPKDLTDDAKAALEQFAAACPQREVRAELMEQAAR